MSGSILSSVTDVLFGSNRGISGLIPNVVIEEGHDDQLEITDHPVDRAANITDNSYELPNTLHLRYGWSPSAPAIGGILGTILPVSAGLVSGIGQLLNGGEDYLTGIYTKLRTLQKSRTPFSVVTGKRRYPTMLLKQISFTTGKDTEYAMIVSLLCREIILVNVTTTQITPQSSQANPQQTAAVTSNGTVQPTAVPQQSILLQGANAITGLFQ